MSITKDGSIMEFTAPVGGVTVDVPLLIGSLLVVPQTTEAAGDPFNAYVGGLMREAPKTASQAWTEGQNLAFKASTGAFTSVLTDGPIVGEAAAAAGSADTTGSVRLDGVAAPRASGVDEGTLAPTVLTTAGAATLTIAQLRTGLIERDPNGASRTDTLPTAALLVAGIPGCKVGDLIRCDIINAADANETITLQAGAGGAFGTNPAASLVIAQNAAKQLQIRVTNVTDTTEAYTAALV